jgi:hypothetical protein
MPRIHTLFSRIQRHIGNYGLLTLSIVLMMLAQPFMNAQGDNEVLTDILFLAIFLAGIYAVRTREFNYRLSILLATVALAGRLHAHTDGSKILPIVVNATAMLFFIHVIYTVGSFVWNERHRVNRDVIFAAVSVYLLIGLSWAYLYEFLEMSSPQSFSGPEPILHNDDFQYFSFVTLATLGYGDIVPVTRPARALSVLEALTGQLYLAILISRLVGAHVSQFSREDKTKP